MKKKMLILFFSLVLMASLVVVANAAMLSDVNNSGRVDAIDARLVLRYSAMLEKFTEEQIEIADVDNSGKVNAVDARKILRVAAKLDPPFEGLDIDKFLVEKGVLNVAVPVDNAPFAYEENGELKGIDIVTMRKLASSVNLNLKLHPMSYDECLDAVKNGKCDMATSYNYNGKYTGFAAPVSYYRNELEAVVLKNSSFDSAEDVRNDSSLRIGVLDNTIGKTVVEKIADKSKITAFATCKDAVIALENGTIDAFVTDTEYTMLTCSRNKTVERLYVPSYYLYNHSVVVAEKNAELLEKIGQYIKVDGVHNYQNIDDTLKLSASQTDLTIITGGTACVEIFADSFYMAEPNFYVTSPYDDCKTQIEKINNRYYLFISAPSDIIGHEYVVLTSSTEIAEECQIKIFIDAEGPKGYQYFNDIYIPDFGVFTTTMPMSTNVIDADYGEIGIIHTYLIEDLYNNGVTDASVLDAYLDTLEAAGYVYDDYIETEDTLTLIFVNEETGMVVTYVEAFNADGYLLGVGVGYLFPVQAD